MSLYVKETVKIWVSDDSSYKQNLFQRNDDALSTRERTDLYVATSGHAFLNANADTTAMGTNDITTIRKVYVEASDKVVLNIKDSGGTGINAHVMVPATGKKATACFDCNLATSGGTFTAQNTSGNTNVTVSWVFVGT